MDNFEVSVVIPAYNVEKYIGQTIQSVIDQTFPAKEIIVVDDGSTDKTAEIIKQYPQVRYIHQPNAGVSVARNTGVDAANYKWIAFLDGDDLWLTDKLAQQKNIIQKHPELVWVAGNFIIDDKRNNRKLPKTTATKAKLWLGEKAYINFFDHWKEFGNSSNIVLLKEIFYHAGKFRAGMVTTEDTDLWLKVAYQYPMIGYSQMPNSIYNFFRPDSSNHIRSNKASIGFMGTLNALQEHLTLAKEADKLPELRMILRSILKGMARRACRGKEYELALEIYKKFPDIICLKTKLYIWRNLAFHKILHARKTSSTNKSHITQIL